MKVVIDTSVLLSAALRDRDPELIVLWIAAMPGWRWMVTMDILAEYKEVLRRPRFNLSADVLERWDSLIVMSTTLVVSEISVDFPRDPKDARFIACALATGSDYLISGDKDLTSIEQVSKTLIFSVNQFKQLFCT